MFSSSSLTDVSQLRGDMVHNHASCHIQDAVHIDRSLLSMHYWTHCGLLPRTRLVGLLFSYIQLLWLS